MDISLGVLEVFLELLERLGVVLILNTIDFSCARRQAVLHLNLVDLLVASLLQYFTGIDSPQRT